MSWVSALIGVALVALVLRDVFHTLFHPGGQGRISRLGLVVTWRLAGRVGGRRRMDELAGPLGLVVVISTWVLLVVLGGALVYWPHLSDGFSYGTGLQPAGRSDLLDALYVSLVTTTTLGFGDVVPTEGWLRATSPLQAVIGFALLTAAVSWVLQVYPALNRRRLLAARLTSLHHIGVHDALPAADSSMFAVLLDGLADQVTQIRVDLTQYAETYYFRARDESTSLPAALPYAAELAGIGVFSDRRDVHLAAAHLGRALDELCLLLGRSFLRTDRTAAEVMAAYARDHGVDGVLGRPPE